ncbi:MAG: hypothetical protein A3I79_01780 [Gemmatimonadetes bacterium RIFCSPLOWO2_02_FULL_71_11]|nr:MAG: hypothetical protein A3I79_01780 [Gemmatimonadetes bacterium RIFCSPLOWO2_02_FULL_71_11]
MREQRGGIRDAVAGAGEVVRGASLEGAQAFLQLAQVAREPPPEQQHERLRPDGGVSGRNRGGLAGGALANQSIERLVDVRASQPNVLGNRVTG